MKKHIFNLLPFNNRMEMSGAEYVIKKLLAFIMIFFVSGVIGEIIVIASYTGMGYDPLHGVMPTGEIVGLVPFYGYILFSIITLLYCRIIEKRNLDDIGLTRKGLDYLYGIGIAIIMLVLITVICCISGIESFSGINTGVNGKGLLLWGIAFVIQGSEEEILCRGFLMNSLKKKVSVPLAVFISSTAFVIPHLIMTSILDSGVVYSIIGVVNLYLISVLFSIIVLWRKNIWISCGLHTAWNYILNSVLGLTVSGIDAQTEGLFVFKINKLSILTGSEYGLEAGIVTTIITTVVICVIIYLWKGKGGDDYGIQ